MTATFARLAESAARQITELLGARVRVVNENGEVLAERVPSNRSAHHAWDSDEACLNEYIRVPVRLNGLCGEIVVFQPYGDEVTSPRVARVLVEMIVNQRLMAAQLDSQYEVRNQFVYKLLTGNSEDESSLILQGQVLGMDLTRPRAVILIGAESYVLNPGALRTQILDEERIRKRVQTITYEIVRFFGAHDNTICAYAGDGQIVILKPLSESMGQSITDDGRQDTSKQSWDSLPTLKGFASTLLSRLDATLTLTANAPLSVAAGRYHAGIPGLARSYQDACIALRLGRLMQGNSRVHSIDMLGTAAFIGPTHESTKAELAYHLLGPLERDPELLSTLQAFFRENCVPSACSQRLCIHRNTLSYRLDKITMLTGLDPRKFDDAVQLQLALLTRSFTSGTAVVQLHDTPATVELEVWANA